MIKIKYKKIKRIKIQKNIRIPIIAVLGLLIIFSAYSAYAAYQIPTTLEEKQPVYNYSHRGQYNYIVHIKNNSLYETEALLPGQGVYFTKLIDHVDATYTYRFSGDLTAEIEGIYTLIGQIQTTLWTKDYTLIPETTFTSNTDQAKFTIEFPINTSIFKNYLTQINNETGVTAQSPTLVLQCTVYLTAHTNYGDVHEIFSPSLQIPLEGNILKIDGTLLTTQSGKLEQKIEVTQAGVIEQRNSWRIASILFSIILIGFVAITATDIIPTTPAQRFINKIKKKYGEWIVESTTPPITKKIETIKVKRFDDLLKISEDLGKPVIHYSTVTKNPGELHTFYVFDENIYYKYILPQEEQVTKTTRCPKCQTRIEYEGTPGKEIKIICPACGKSGKTTIEKPIKNGFLRKIKIPLVKSKNN